MTAGKGEQGETQEEEGNLPSMVQNQHIDIPLDAEVDSDFLIDSKKKKDLSGKKRRKSDKGNDASNRKKKSVQGLARTARQAKEDAEKAQA